MEDLPSEESVEALLEEKFSALNRAAQEILELLQLRRQARTRAKSRNVTGKLGRCFFMQRVAGLVGVSDHMVREALKAGDLGFTEPEGTGQQKSRIIFETHLRTWGKLLEKQGYKLEWLDDSLFRVLERK